MAGRKSLHMLALFSPQKKPRIPCPKNNRRRARRQKVMPERPIRQRRFGHPGSRRVAGQRRRRGLSHLDSAS